MRRTVAQMMMEKKLNIAIAGATGFVGRELGRVLGAHHNVRGLGRSIPKSETPGFAEWRKTNLLSLLEAEKALDGIDIAYYLVHSMMPSTHLTQGRFQDFDLIAADNFARSAKEHGVKQVIYLGGLVPEGEKLSAHLQSRLEVEDVLATYGTPVTTLRASMIVGPGGSSFVIMKRLVERLPIMLCPGWTRTLSQPIALEDVVKLLAYCAAKPELYAQHFDVGGPDVLSYQEMMQRTARILGKKLRIVPAPLFNPRLSRLWVTAVTGAPKALIQPLIESLQHEMIADDRRLQEMAGVPGATFDEMVKRTLAAEPKDASEPSAFRGNRGAPTFDVGSIQRFRMPDWVSARWVANEYLRWLPRFFVSIFRVKVTGNMICSFYLWPVNRPLLIMAYSKERSSEGRALFYVTGGSLSRLDTRGRLEFREVLNRKFVLASVFDFQPRLPWSLYKFTQAVAHLWVMKAFGRHLQRIAERAG